MTIETESSYDSENPFNSLGQRRKVIKSIKKTPEKSSSESDEDEGSNSIDVVERILQGSFLPVALLCYKEEFALNEFIVDPSSQAMLVHYLGHYGNVKALKTFVESFDLDLNSVDKFGQTILHYAARRGQLNLLQYLQRFHRHLDFDQENVYNFSPVVYTLLNQ